MANIQEYLQAILAARYGKDVRQSIHDAIDAINVVNEANVATVQDIADEAQGYATSASSSASTATQAVTDAQTAKIGAETAQSNAETAEDNAEYWYNQAKNVAESLSGALRPIGTVAFANLPSVASATEGDMYNISDEFTTTSDFVEGAGVVVPLGSNVYKTNGGKWDVLAGSPVTGVKGDSENSYRKGNVNITKANIGLGNVDNTSDADKPISTATQNAIDNIEGRITDVENNLTDIVKVIDVTKSVSTTARQTIDVQMTFTPPTGYKAILATINTSGSWGWKWITCRLNSPTLVYATIQSTEDTNIDGICAVKVLCIRDI